VPENRCAERRQTAGRPRGRAVFGYARDWTAPERICPLMRGGCGDPPRGASTAFDREHGTLNACLRSARRPEGPQSEPAGRCRCSGRPPRR